MNKGNKQGQRKTDWLTTTKKIESNKSDSIFLSFVFSIACLYTAFYIHKNKQKREWTKEQKKQGENKQKMKIK